MKRRERGKRSSVRVLTKRETASRVSRNFDANAKPVYHRENDDSSTRLKSSEGINREFVFWKGARRCSVHIAPNLSALPKVIDAAAAADRIAPWGDAAGSGQNERLAQFSEIHFPNL